MRTLIIGNKNYSRWSLRAWLALKEAGVEFDEQQIALDRPQTKAEILRHSPSGKVPCLVDGPLVVWDSLAICETANERYVGGALWPAGDEARAHARAVTAEMHSGFGMLRQVCTMNVGLRVRLRERPAALEADIADLQPRCIAHRNLERVAGHIHRRDLQRRALARDGQCDGAAAGAEIRYGRRLRT